MLQQNPISASISDIELQVERSVACKLFLYIAFSTSRIRSVVILVEHNGWCCFDRVSLASFKKDRIRRRVDIIRMTSGV